MPRGRKKNYHNRGRHFTNPDELKAAEEKEAREKEWRKQRGLPSDSEEDEGGKEEEVSGARSGGGGGGGGGKTAPTQGAPGELPPSSSEGETDSDDDSDRHKGVAHLIEIENPNRIKQKSKKVTALDTEEGPSLSRREKEELEKQQAKERYMKAHLAGKTEEARADLARLALIRKQREEAARKKNEEKLALDAKKKAAEDKLIQKKKTDKSK